jgi:uncharacterized membrane-anchored protein YjiN (DUF445 family)
LNISSIRAIDSSVKPEPSTVGSPNATGSHQSNGNGARPISTRFRVNVPQGMSVTAQDFQRRALGRNRLIATALLAAMAALFVAASLLFQPGFWTLLVRATAEAALVGGLADWFAVTALFRRPLGLPIPHTAIVPNNKDRIGEGLAIFIEQNFLTPEIIRAKVRSLEPARLIADWLSVPANADAVARRIIRMLPHLIGAIDDRDVRVFVGEALDRRLTEIELAPLLGRAVSVLTAGGFHETLIDRLVDVGGRFIAEREEQLYDAAGAQRRRWWIPKAVNRQIAKAIIDGVKELLSTVREPGTPARRSLVEGIERLAEQLGGLPSCRERVEQAKLRLLEDAEIKAWLGSLWSDIKQGLLADLGSPQSQVHQPLAAAILSLGRHLLADAPMRRRVERTIEAVVVEALPWRGGLAQLFVGVVRQWDSASFTHRIELVVGRDLQYIRINGTLVGGLVGCVLYLLSVVFE